MTLITMRGSSSSPTGPGSSGNEALSLTGALLTDPGGLALQLRLGLRPSLKGMGADDRESRAVTPAVPLRASALITWDDGALTTCGGIPEGGTVPLGGRFLLVTEAQEKVCKENHRCEN